jgi:curved DNA-binding protein CbpA
MSDSLPSNASELDPYAVLEVPNTATPAEIRTAYRKLALKCHPDKTPLAEREAAHTKFQELAFCYAILSDEARRKRYDATGSTSESAFDEEGFDWKEFFSAQFKKVGADAIEEFRKEYQGEFYLSFLQEVPWRIFESCCATAMGLLDSLDVAMIYIVIAVRGQLANLNHRKRRGETSGSTSLHRWRG